MKCEEDATRSVAAVRSHAERGNERGRAIEQAMAESGLAEEIATCEC
jgi:hypothetical protein